MVDPAAGSAEVPSEGGGVIADRGVRHRQDAVIIRNAAAYGCGSIITNKAMRNIEGPGVADATTAIAALVVRYGTMVDGQCGLFIKNAAPRRRVKRQAPTTNGDALDGDSVVSQNVKNAKLGCA